MASGAINRNTSVWLDVMRGLSAQAVVLGHLYQLFFFGSHAGPESAMVMHFHTAIIVASRYSHDAVMVFFVLSGYLVGGPAARALAQGNFSWNSYLPDRLIRLWTVLLPCLLLTLLFDAISIHFGSGLFVIGNWASIYPRDWLSDDPWSAVRLIANASFLTRVVAPMYGSNMSLWSLTNEFWYYLALPAIGTMFIGTSAQRVFSSAVIVASGVVLVKLEEPLAVPFVVGFLIWLLGALLYNAPRFKFMPLWLAVLLAAATYLLWQTSPGTGSIMRDVWMGTATACVIGLSKFVPGGSLKRIGAFFAGYSFSLYAIHLPVLILLFSIDPLTSLTRVYGLNDLFRFVGYAVVANVVAVAFWYGFERRTRAIKQTIHAVAARIRWLPFRG